MEKTNLKITTATIRLNTVPYYFEHHCYWAWDILFEDYPLFSFNSLTWLYMGDSKEEARKTCRTIKKVFANNSILDKSKVSVLYDEDGIIAIGRDSKDCYIHVRDHFTVKTFTELNLNLASLAIACNS